MYTRLSKIQCQSIGGGQPPSRFVLRRRSIFQCRSADRLKQRFQLIETFLPLTGRKGGLCDGGRRRCHTFLIQAAQSATSALYSISQAISHKILNGMRRVAKDGVEITCDLVLAHVQVVQSRIAGKVLRNISCQLILRDVYQKQTLKLSNRRRNRTCQGVARCITED